MLCVGKDLCLDGHWDTSDRDTASGKLNVLLSFERHQIFKAITLKWAGAKTKYSKKNVS